MAYTLKESNKKEMAESLAVAYENLSRHLRNEKKLEEEIGDCKIVVGKKGHDFFLCQPIFSFELIQDGQKVVSKNGSYDEIFNHYFYYSLALKSEIK